jgi:hypothetical protein
VVAARPSRRLGGRGPEGVEDAGDGKGVARGVTNEDVMSDVAQGVGSTGALAWVWSMLPQAPTFDGLGQVRRINYPPPSLRLAVSLEVGLMGAK